MRYFTEQSVLGFGPGGHNQPNTSQCKLKCLAQRPQAKTEIHCDYHGNI